MFGKFFLYKLLQFVFNVFHKERIDCVDIFPSAILLRLADNPFYVLATGIVWENPPLLCVRERPSILLVNATLTYLAVGMANI